MAAMMRRRKIIGVSFERTPPLKELGAVSMRGISY
jgi:hypothetical protein